MKLFVGLDAGTSGGRCLVVDERGHVVAFAERAWSYVRDGVSSAELDPQATLDALADATREAIASVDGSSISAIGVTSQRTGVVLLDDEDRVLYAGANADGRQIAEGITHEREHGARIYEIAARLPAMLYLPARLAWLRNNHPDVAARIASALSIGDRVVHALTGERATDATQAAEMLVYDVAAGMWSDELLEALDVPASILPRIVNPGASAGAIRDVAAERFGLPAGTPVVSGGADTQAAALALGAVDAGDTTVIAGTTMLCGTVRPEPMLDDARRLWTSPTHLGTWVQEAHCGEAGAAVEWAARLMNVTPAEAARAADPAAPGCGGVVFVDPYPSIASDFTLVRAGGFSFPVPLMALGRERADLLRAVFEGVAFAARAGLEWLGDGSDEVAVAGGVARSAAFRAALAGSLERPVRVSSVASSSALGAAILAAAEHHGGVAAAADAMHDRGTVVTPDETHGYPAHYAVWAERAEATMSSAMRMSGLMG